MIVYNEMFDTEALITEVQRRPLLYDIHLPDYINREKKNLLWIEIATLIYKDWNFVNPDHHEDRVEKLMKRWKALRDNFVKEHRRYTSGIPINKKRYIYYDRLLFLLPYLKANADIYRAAVQQNTDVTDTEDGQDQDWSQSDVYGHRTFMLSFVPVLNNMPYEMALRMRRHISQLFNELAASESMNRNSDIKKNTSLRESERIVEKKDLKFEAQVENSRTVNEQNEETDNIINSYCIPIMEDKNSDSYNGTKQINSSAYQQYLGQLPPLQQERRMKEACTSNLCLISTKRFCSTFNEDRRTDIFNHFWENRTWDQKRTFLLSHINFTNVLKRKHKDEDKHRRKKTIIYKLHNGTERVQVCQNMFINTLGINRRMIEEWTKKMFCDEKKDENDSENLIFLQPNDFHLNQEADISEELDQTESLLQHFTDSLPHHQLQKMNKENPIIKKPKRHSSKMIKNAPN